MDAPRLPELRPGPFISYAREDQAFVRILHDALLMHGRDAWVDWEIFPSAEWMREVRSAIDAAPAVIFVMSPDSIASAVCREELVHTLAQNKRLIPVVCRNVEAAAVDESIRKINWIHVLDPDQMEEKVTQLIEAMDADLDWIHAHARLLVRAGDWESRGHDRSLLLRGNALKDVEEWLVKVGSNRTPRPTALQTQYVIASRKAQTARQRYTLAGVSVALVVTAVLAVYALIQSHVAEHQRDIALSRLLAAHSLKNSSDTWGRLDLALLLSVAANQIEPTLEARNSLFSALMETNRVRKFIHNAHGTLTSMAISPDGRTVATGSFRGDIVLYDVETLEPRLALEHGNWVVESLAFSPDGRTLASAASGATVRGQRQIVLWDARSGQELRAMAGGHKDVRWVAWDPDGTRLLSGGYELAISFWDPATGNRETGVFAHGRGIVRHHAVSPDGKTIAAATEGGGGVTLWDVATRAERMALHGHKGMARAVAFSPDGALLASGGEDATIIISESQGGTPRMTLKGHSGRIECVAFSPDGTRLVSASTDRTVILWDLTTGKPVEVLRGHTNTVTNVAFTPDSKTLVSVGFEGTFIVWNLGMPRHRATLTGHEADVRAVAVSPDGAILASASDDGTVRLWDLASGQERGLLKEYREVRGVRREARGKVESVAFSPNGALLASGGEGRRIMLWDASSGRQVKEIDIGAGLLTLAFSADSRSIASAGSTDRSIVVWDIETGEQQAKLSGHDSETRSLQFSRDGEILVSGHGDGTVRVWGVSTRRETREPMYAGSSLVMAALSPDGRTAASSSAEAVLLWALSRSEKPVVVLAAVDSPSHSRIAYSPDGKTLAYSTGEAGFGIVLWDLASGRPRVRLEGFATTTSMTFTTDGRRLVTGHYRGNVALWDAAFEDWPRRACEIANRNFTRDEWKAFLGEEMPYRAVCPRRAD